MAFEVLKKKSNYFKFEDDGDVLEGYYLGAEASTYEGDPVTKQNFQLANGETVFISGTTLLNDRLKAVELGTMTRITFEGEVPKKKGKGKYREFKVEQDRDATIPVTPKATAVDIIAAARVS